MVKQNLIDIFKKQNFLNPQNSFDIDETVVKHIDNIWSFYLLDMID